MKNMASKISKLIAKADSSTHEEEADAFMAKAHALMMEHGLSLLDLGRLDADDPIGHDFEVHQSSDGWKNKVAQQLCKFYGCQMVFVPNGRTTMTYTVFGRESARITFTIMLPFVFKQIAKLARELRDEGVYPNIQKAKNRIANSLAVRIFEMRTENEASTANAHGAKGLNALVPVDLIRAAVEAEYPTLQSGGKQKYTTDSHSRAAAGRVSLHRQATKAPASRQLT